MRELNNSKESGAKRKAFELRGDDCICLRQYSSGEFRIKRQV